MKKLFLLRKSLFIAFAAATCGKYYDKNDKIGIPLALPQLWAPKWRLEKLLR